MNRVLLLIFLSLVAVSFSRGQQTQVMVMDIKAEIDPPMRRYVELAIEHAEDIEADVVIIEMDTYGGVLTDAKEIVDILMKFKKPLWVFINADAASAGALISIACDSIYMSPGASIGAASVVDGSGQKLPDKYQSYMRSIMRSTAEENHRDPRIAEAMVDEDVPLDSIKPAGKILTFSTSEAIKHNYCEGKVNSIDEILRKNKIESYTIEHYELSAVDSIIAFFMNPVISGLLIMMIMAGIYFEIQAPGLGLAGLLAVIALVLYLVPYFLSGLAEYWEVLALIGGIALIGVEILILPGFGVAGISGIVIVISSLVLIMLNNDAFNFDFVGGNDILIALTVSAGGVIGGILLLFIGGSKLQDTKAFDRVALTDTMDKSKGYTSSFLKESMTGKRGVAHTVLRPGGKVNIDGVIYDAYTGGEFVEPGIEIVVIGDETTSLRVKPIPS
jgi:membrane-bound serine protease (ClpP class)